jgi:nucleoside-diphosphate-sugar epimerase
VTSLITGGAGFLGSHLAEHLLEQGTAVTVIDDMSRGATANLREIESHDRLTVHDVDLRQQEELDSFFEGHSQVYHLAAKIGGVGYLRDQPATIMTDNDLINQQVFDACVAAGVDRIVYASSSMLYAEADTFPTAESIVSEIPPPRGSYGFQKLNGEYYCDAYNREHNLEYVAARIFNVVGPRDWPEQQVGQSHVVPDIVKKVVELRQNPVAIKGSGQQTRCFTDVRDTVRGLRKCMETENAATEAFNLSTTTETSIRDLVRLIWELADRSGSLNTETEAPFEKDIKRRVPKIKKADRILDWKPKYTLRESLDWYISAYESRLSGS